MRLRHLIASLAITVSAVPALAHADGVSGLLEADARRSVSSYQDQGGGQTQDDVNRFGQRLRLTLDRTLFPNVRFSIGGLLENVSSWIPPVTPRFSGAQLGQFHARLNLTGPSFNASAGYSRRMQYADGFASSTVAGLINEAATLHLNWREPGSPSVSLLFSRPALYDTRRELSDRSSLDGQLTLAWDPLPRLNLQYSGAFSDGRDVLRRTAAFTTSNSARASYMTTMFDGRTTVAASAHFTERSTSVRSSGPGGLTETLQSPVGGLSLIETFPNTPALSTLVSNAALVDGNTAEPAGLNLGTSALSSGEALPRDLATEFAAPFPAVNRFFVWVDKQLPAALASNFQWQAYQSEDNLNWTPILPDGPATFSLFQNRFEIPIQRTTARFVKLVTRPLLPSMTTDPQFAELFVTELQPLLVEPVPPAQTWSHSGQTLLNASARTRITEDFVHDVSAQVGASLGTAAPANGTYSLSNGLTYTRQLAAQYLLSGRLARQDSDYGRGHQGALQLGASLAANWLPTLAANVAYSAQLLDNPEGWGSTQSLSVLGSAIPYRNIAAQLGASLSLTSPAKTTASLTDIVTASLTAQPHARLSVTGSYGHSATRPLAGTQQPTTSERVDANFSFNPFPALYLNAGAGWSLMNGRGTPLANAAIGFSPFRGGDLQLGLSFSQNLDSSGGLTQMLTPSVRWNVRRGMLLTASYTLLDSDTLTAHARSQSFGATMQLTL